WLGEDESIARLAPGGSDREGVLHVRTCSYLRGADHAAASERRPPHTRRVRAALRRHAGPEEGGVDRRSRLYALTRSSHRARISPYGNRDLARRVLGANTRHARLYGRERSSGPGQRAPAGRPADDRARPRW